MVKTYLQEVRNERLEIRQLEERIEELRMSLLPSAIRYDKPQIQTSPEDPMLKIEAEISELEDDLREKLGRLVRRYRGAVRLISRLESSIHRSVLWEYYLNSDKPTWDVVADKMGYSKERLYQLHAEAIDRLEGLDGISELLDQ